MGNTSKDTMGKQWLSVKEVSAYLGLKPATVYQYVSERRIPFHKVPGSSIIRFDVSEIDDWMDKGRVETKEEYLSRSIKERRS